MNTTTELIFILDQSSSMQGLVHETLEGYNSLLASQQQLDSPCRLTTVLFADQPGIVHDRVDILQAKPMTAWDYQPRGYTALLDALGMSINRIGYLQKYSPQHQRAGKVMVAIITDGQENASRHYRLPQIRRMIEHQRQRFGWEFIFLGANMDAMHEAASYGIQPEHASDYIADSQGTDVSFSALAEVVVNFRQQRKDFTRQLDRTRQDQHARRQQ